MGITSSTALWYASRATGVVALVLLTVVVVLGILVNRRGRLPGLPRFATTSLHRSMSLLAVAFTAVHVLTAIADPYVAIGIAAAVIPFTSAYKPLWIGLGAVSLDIIAALIVTSLARARIGRRTWRAVHWLAYASWPVALVPQHRVRQRPAQRRPPRGHRRLYGGGGRRHRLADRQRGESTRPGGAGGASAGPGQRVRRRPAPG